MVEHPFTNAVDQLLLGEFTVVQKSFQEFLAGLRHRLHHHATPGFHLVGHGIGDRSLNNVLPQIVLVEVGLVAYQIHNAAQIPLCANGKLDREGIGPQAGFDLLVDTQEVGAGAVHFVDKDHAWHLVAVRLTPDRFRLGLDTAHGAEHGNDPIQNPHGALHLNGEVHVAGGVDDIDAVVSPTGGDGGGSDGDAPLLLLGHPIRCGSSVVDLSQFVNHTGIKQDPLRGGRLAGINVGGNANVANAVQGDIAGHGKPPKCVLLYRERGQLYRQTHPPVAVHHHGT